MEETPPAKREEREQTEGTVVTGEQVKQTEYQLQFPAVVAEVLATEDLTKGMRAEMELTDNAQSIIKKGFPVPFFAE
jgi:hypothetical protein